MNRRNNKPKDCQFRRNRGMGQVNYGALKEQIKSYAFSIGISKIGFTDAEPLFEHLPLLEQRINAHYGNAINEGDREKRIHPTKHMPDAKSVISVAVAYPGLEKYSPVGQGLPRGRFSFISRGRDYHAVVREKLETLIKYILKAKPESKLMLMVDKEEILEKALAVKAGLGWFGKNTLLVTPEYGSWVCLGELVTDIPFPVDRPMEGKCGTCRACIEACPTNALDKERNLDLDRCLASVTQGRTLPDRETRIQMGINLYGCDICQSVCPHNSRQDKDDKDFAYVYDEAFPLLSEVLGLSNREFKKKFGHTSGAWRGRTLVQRNAVIAAGNVKDEGMVPQLALILTGDSRQIMRGAAAWALGQIGGNRALKALTQAIKHENDPAVLAEIKYCMIHFGNNS